MIGTDRIDTDRYLYVKKCIISKSDRAFEFVVLLYLEPFEPMHQNQFFGIGYCFGIS
jgi:hypothetical protein